MSEAELSQKQLLVLQARLEQLCQELKSQLQNSASATDTVELDQTLLGRVSRIDAIQQQSVALSARKKVQLRLQKVLAAIDRFNSSDYGYCHQCDEGIAFQRLEVQPESILCLPCQSKRDEISS